MKVTKNLSRWFKEDTMPQKNRSMLQDFASKLAPDLSILPFVRNPSLITRGLYVT